MAPPQIDHCARARLAWPHLVTIARQKGQITYGDLTAKLGLHHRSAHWLLGVIQTHCEMHELPPLQAVVVYRKTGVPGLGYRATPAGGSAYKRALNRVYAAPWENRAPF